jgi:ribosomal protein S14
VADYFIMLNPAGSDQVKIIRELRRLKVPFALIGGVAMSAYREARFTKDIDVIVPADKIGTLVNHLASLVGGRAFRFSHARGKNYFRIKIGRHVVADVAPDDLYPQYAGALASARPRKIADYESLGTVPVTGREEMIALKIRSSLSPHRRSESVAKDETDVYYLLAGADLLKVRDALHGVPGGIEQLARLVAVWDARRGKKNPQARSLGDQRVRCRTCGRHVAVVRGGKLRAHDFNYRRCAGSGGFA